MGDIIVDGKTRVFSIPDTGQDLTALSAATINSGEALHEVLVPTGLEGFEGTTETVDTTSLASSYNTALPGRTSFSGTGLVCKKQDDTDPVFTQLSVKDTKLIIVILDGEDSGSAVAATDTYEAYPVTTGEFNYVGRGEANSVLRYRVPTPLSRPRVRGTAAA